MFELNAEEQTALRYHFGTSRRGGFQYTLMVFTDQSVARLISICGSENVNKIAIYSNKHRSTFISVYSM